MDGIRNVHEVIRKDVTNISRLCGRMSQEHYAASVQEAFEQIVITQLEKHRALVEQSSGLVLAGGGAYNVLLNTQILEHFQKRVYIPTGPGDISPAIGAVWRMEPSLVPQSEYERLYLGRRFFSKEAAVQFASTHHGSRTTPAEVAALLVQSKIVAVLQGRQAIGPHPLGRATIFAQISELSRSHMYAVHSFRDHLWMPTLVCREQDAHHLFDWNHDRSLLWSPTGLVAPWLKPELESESVGIHPRASGEIIQLQTVTREQNAWLYDILDAYVTMLHVGQTFRGRDIGTGVLSIFQARAAVRIFVGESVNFYGNRPEVFGL